MHLQRARISSGIVIRSLLCHHHYNYHPCPNSNSALYRSFSNDPGVDNTAETLAATTASRLFSTTTTTTTTNKNKTFRSDPTAKRPNRYCDPYGQGGKPLQDIQTLQTTIHAEWKVEYRQDDDNDDTQSTTTTTTTIPVAIVREFWHPDFLTGARFVQRMAAVAQLNAHYPSIMLDRRPMTAPRQQKYWQVISTIRCSTLVLGGLSTHDFHLAMLIDVEAERDDIQPLLIKS